MTVKFKEWDCTIVFGKYHNGRTAIQLMDVEDGGPVAVATINIPDCIIAKDFVIIKDYSENEGMLTALIQAGVISRPKTYVQTGFSTCPICQLLIKPNYE